MGCGEDPSRWIRPWSARVRPATVCSHRQRRVRTAERRRPDADVETHTDAEGKFEFTDVPSGRRFRVNVQPPGFPSRMVWFTTQTGMDENYDEFRLYDASKDIRLTFQTTLEVPIQVVCPILANQLPTSLSQLAMRWPASLRLPTEKGEFL